MAGSPHPVRSEYSHALEIAQRLAREGAQPFAEHCSRYVALHGKRQGERIEFGPPLRANRMFPTRTRSKAERLGREFAAFAARRDQSDWFVWGIHQPTRKTAIEDLVCGLRQFNKQVNRTFSQLRKLAGFELLIFGIHIEFDHSTQLFDIHAHFVCEVPLAIREKVQGRLMESFSRTYTPDDKLRSAHGFAKYAARTYKLHRVVDWPVSAQLAAWQLQGHQFRYVRTGGAFARFRRELKLLKPKRAKRKTRARAQDISTQRDQPLVRKMWKVAGEYIPGTLFRSSSPKRSADAAPPASCHSSTFAAVTQPSLHRHRPIDPGLKDNSSGGNPDELTLRFALAKSRASMVAKVYGRNRVGRIQVTPDRSHDMSNYVTRAEVHAAADRVDADGKKPSAPSVRQIIGRGSNSTIFEHLKTWVPRDQRLELPAIPDALSNTVSALTADLWHMVRNFAGEETATRIAQATADTTEAQAAAAAVGDQADRLAADLGAAQERVAELEKLVAERDQQIGEYANYAYQLEIDAARKDAEIETLRQMLSEFAPAAGETRKSTKPTKVKADDAAQSAAA